MVNASGSSLDSGTATEELTLGFLQGALAIKGPLLVEFAGVGAAAEEWPAAGCRAFLTSVTAGGEAQVSLAFDLTAFAEHNELIDASLSAPRAGREGARFVSRRVVVVPAGGVVRGLSLLEESSLALYREYLDTCVPGYPYLHWLERELVRLRKAARRG